MAHFNGQSLRVLHVGQMSVPAVGVIRQMQAEQTAAERLGIHWHARLFCPAGSSNSPVVVSPDTPGSGRAFLKRAYYRWLDDNRTNYDVILLRYSFYDPLQLRFVTGASVPVWSVHHTLEVPEIRGFGGLKSHLRAALEALIGPITLKRTAGIVAVTREIGEYERKRCQQPDKPLIVYPNGAEYGEKPALPAAAGEGVEIPELLFVSSQFGPWLGLDLLHAALAANPQPCRVHVVGHLNESQKTLLADDARFVLHGTLDADAIEALMQRSRVGLASFGLHRKNMQEACNLKVRDYLRAGLPVYASYRDVFPEDFPYFRQGPVDLDAILEFSTAMASVDRQTISETSRPLIEKGALLTTVYEKLNSAYLP